MQKKKWAYKSLSDHKIIYLCTYYLIEEIEYYECQKLPSCSPQSLPSLPSPNRTMNLKVYIFQPNFHYIITYLWLS